MLKRDGEPIVEAPVDVWIAAQVLAEVTVALWGGPVSVVRAVIDAQPPTDLGAPLDPITDEEWTLFAAGAGFEP